MAAHAHMNIDNASSLNTGPKGVMGEPGYDGSKGNSEIMNACTDYKFCLFLFFSPNQVQQVRQGMLEQ